MSNNTPEELQNAPPEVIYPDILSLESQIRHLRDVYECADKERLEDLQYTSEILTQRFTEVQDKVAELQLQVSLLSQNKSSNSTSSFVPHEYISQYVSSLRQRIRWAVGNPLKFMKKYIYKGMPTYSQVMWAWHNPMVCIKKHIFGITPARSSSVSSVSSHVQSNVGVLSGVSSFDQSSLLSFPQVDASFVRSGEVCVVLHLYYIDMWPEMVRYLKRIPVEFHLIVTLTDGRYTVSDIDAIRSVFPTVVIRSFPNKGMDILPFLHVLNDVPSTCLYVLKIHTKKSLHMQGDEGSRWFYDLMDNVLRNSQQVVDILRLLSDGSVGMVGGSKIFDGTEHVQKCFDRVRARAGVSDIAYQWVSGTMFWVRADILKPLKNNDFLSYVERYQPEGYLRDQTPVHAIERLFGLLVYAQGKTLSQVKRKKVLFINHQESRTGAPKIVKEYIKRIIGDDEFDYAVVSKIVIDDPWFDVPNRYVLSEMGQETDEEKMRFIEQCERPDLVVGNTIEAALLLPFVESKKIIFIHEYRSLYGYIDQLPTLRMCDEVWVGNRAAAKILSQYGVQARVMPYYLQVAVPSFDAFPPVDGKPYFLGAGFVQYRKGLDRFFELARALPNERFVWVGDVSQGQIHANGTCTFVYQSFQEDGYKAGDLSVSKQMTLDIPSNVEFVGVVPEDELVGRWIAQAKAFLMVSYDDPFPLVGVYAKILQKPMLVMSTCGDVHTLCKEPDDLILDSFDVKKATSFLSKIVPRECFMDYGLKNYFYNNYSHLRNYILDKNVDGSSKESDLEHMVIFTAIHSASQPFAFELLDKLLSSVSVCQPVQVYVITDKKTELLESTIHGRAHIIEHRHRLYDELAHVYVDRPQTIGTYFRTEIPFLCNKLGIVNTFVLYVDYDILFLGDVRRYLKGKEPLYIAAAPCMQKSSPEDINAGVLYMNVRSLQKIDSDFMDFIRPRLAELRQTDGQDQQAYREFFAGKIVYLSEEMNWKPYWGINHEAAILHYHWIKPQVDIATDPVGKRVVSLPRDMMNVDTLQYYQRFWKQFYDHSL